MVSVEIPGQMPRYERADKGHHHHFVCRVCGGVFELEDVRTASRRWRLRDSRRRPGTEQHSRQPRARSDANSLWVKVEADSLQACLE